MPLAGVAWVARLAAVAGLAALVAEVLARRFDGNPRALLLGVAVGTPLAVGLLARLGRAWPRRSLTAALSATATGLPVVLALIVAGSAAAVLSGPERMLTAAPPFEAAGGELSFAVLAVGTAAGAAACLAVLVRWALAAALPPLVLLGASLTVGAEPAPSWVAPSAVVLVGALMLARGPDARVEVDDAGGPAGRGLGTATAVVGGVVVVATGLSVLAVGGRMPGADADRPRFDARDLVTPPAGAAMSARPLASLFGLRTSHADADLFQIWAPQDADGRVQAAVLPVFDGYGWAPGGTYRRASRIVPDGPECTHGSGCPSAPAGSDRPGTIVRVEIVNHDALPWVPSLGRPAEVSQPGLLVDEESGSLFAPAPLRGVLEVTGVPSHDPGGTLALRTAVAAPARRPLAPEVRQAAVELGIVGLLGASQPGMSAFVRLAALADRFQRTGGFRVADHSEEIPNGSGLLSVRDLLRRKEGTAEQYASAMALAALLDGYDARVVVGFRVPDGAAGPAGAMVEAGHVDAWAEVRFEGVGWVPFTVTPTTGEESQASAPSLPRRGTLPAAVEAARAEVTEQIGQPGWEGGDALSPAQAGEGGVAVWPVVAAVLAVSVLGVLLASVGVATVKALRRRRRRRLAVPSRRVLAAWRETVDRMAEVGVPVRPALTRRELSALAVDRHPTVDATTLEEFRRLVDEAEFSGTPAGDAEAAHAWRMADATRRTLVAGLPPVRRIGVVIDPRPFLPVGAVWRSAGDDSVPDSGSNCSRCRGDRAGRRHRCLAR